METLFKVLIYRVSLILGLFFVTTSVSAKSSDVGVCFLKTDKQTIQSKINEIAMNSQQSTLIQQQVRFFNDLTSLFIPVDTFNYKLFWVQQPNNDWLQKNCFKYGYITLMDYNRRAITRVYSNSVSVASGRRTGSRFPANATAIPQADPAAEDEEEHSNTPFDPQAPAVSPYMVPQINLYNYYGSANNPNATQAEAQPAAAAAKPVVEEAPTKKEDNLNVNVNVGDQSKSKDVKTDDSVVMRRASVYDLPEYMSEPSYFMELTPFMAYENIENVGSGTTNKFGMFGYGTDLKLGYRFNPHFNYYLRGRYMSIEVRSVKSPVTVDLKSNGDFSYGLGIEHVASRFLSLALEYNALQMQSFEQVGVLTNVESFKESFQTVNLDFKLNFISRDEFKFGLHGNYGVIIADNSKELIYDFKTKLYLIKSFEGDFFGLNLGYEQNKFLYDLGATSETTRKRFVFSLNFGFEL